MYEDKNLIGDACNQANELSLEIKSIENGTRLISKGETEKGLIEGINKKKSFFAKKVMEHIGEYIKNSGLDPLFFNYLMTAINNGDLVALGYQEYSVDRSEKLSLFQRYKIALMVRYYVSNRKKDDKNSRELVIYKIQDEKVYLDKTSISKVCRLMKPAVDEFIRAFNPQLETTKNGKLKLQTMPSDEEIDAHIEKHSAKTLFRLMLKGRKIISNTDKPPSTPEL